jgi:uncharacterized protein (TIGR03118 family)
MHRPGSRCSLTLEALEDRSLMSAGFLQTNLASDIPGLAQSFNPLLINPWGISFGPEGAFWLSNAGSGASSILGNNGNALSSIAIPSPGAFVGGSPTGTVFNDSNGFAVSEGGRSGSSFFLFAGQDGTISGWNPQVDLTHAVVAVDYSGAWDGTGPAVFKGLALGTNSQGTFLFATDFRAGSIDVFDSNFKSVQPSGSFSDPSIPHGFAPFNVQNIGGHLFVTYARQAANGYDQVAGAGSGFVDEFDTNGRLLRHFASGGVLDTPWGVAMAPSTFGRFANDLLIGNFGDGRINAFDPRTGAFVGALTDLQGNPIQIVGLWGLAFGNGQGAGRSDTLYFAAGIGNQHHGLFGMIQATPVANVPLGPDYHGSDSTNGKDNYPLPPPTGPQLNGDLIAQPALAEVLTPMSNGSMALAPTLLTVTNAGPARGDGTGQIVVSATGTGFNLSASGSLLGRAVTTNLAGGMDGAATNTLAAALEMFLDPGIRLGPLSTAPMSASEAPRPGLSSDAFPNPAAPTRREEKNSESPATPETDGFMESGMLEGAFLPVAGPLVSAGHVLADDREPAGLVQTVAGAETTRDKEQAPFHGFTPPLIAFLMWSGVTLVWNHGLGPRRLIPTYPPCPPAPRKAD